MGEEGYKLISQVSTVWSVTLDNDLHFSLIAQGGVDGDGKAARH